MGEHYEKLLAYAAAMTDSPPEIRSPGNERIKRLVRLRARRHRDHDGLFVVEGRDLDRAINAGLRPLELYRPAVSSAYDADVEFVVSGPALEKASYRSDRDTIIGVFPQFAHQVDALDLPDTPLILVAENLEKPGNLGAIIRTAAAAGADLVLAPQGFDIFNPNVIRSSTGAVFTMPVVPMAPATATKWLRSRRVEIVAADPIGGVAPWEVDMTGPTAIVVGDEHSGLSPQLKAEADQIVTIPMAAGGVDSLNSSVSAAILVFEAVRQRSS